MALPPLVDVARFKDWPGVNIGVAQDAAAEAVLGAVSARVRDLAGRTWVDTATPPALEGVPDVIESIVLTVAARVWANPDGRSQRANGPFTAGWAEKLQGLTFTADERAVIERAAAGEGAFTGIGTIATTRGPLETGRVCPTEMEEAAWW